MNEVIAGDYSGTIAYFPKDDCLCISIVRGFSVKKIPINKHTVAFYDLMDSSSKTSFSSGVVRGAAGAAIFGPIGAIAGASSAKKKSSYTVSIQFRDGRSALIEIDEKNYKYLVKTLY